MKKNTMNSPCGTESHTIPAPCRALQSTSRGWISKPKFAKAASTALPLSLLLFAAGFAHGQITNVGGTGTIGDTTLTTTAGTATTPVFRSWRTNGSNSNNTTLESPVSLAVTSTGNVTLTFTHRYNFESGWDGGAVYYTKNGEPATYVTGASFTSNGYVGTTTANSSSAWAGGESVFYGTSAGYSTPAMITSVANLGSFDAGDVITVQFRGEWDEGTLNSAPNWDIASVQLTDASAANLLNANFDANGDSGFLATGSGGVWAFSSVASISKFELDANTNTADRYKPDIAGPTTTIDITGAIIQVSLLNGTLELGDTFSLFDLSGGTTLTGTPASISLPGEAIWDTSLLASAGTITVSQLPADGTWITDLASNWGTTTNWAGGPPGIVAFGADKNAFFTANITAARTVTLESSRTIGNITFTDSTTSSNDLTISGANILTLDVTTGTPVIDVTQTGNRQLTISSVIAGSDGLQKNGPGILNLTGANTYTGTTSITDGLLNFGSANLDGIGGGPGSRDISVTANKIVQRTASALNAAFMKRLVETNDEFAVCSNASGASDVGTGNVVDFSSSTNGANLPNAFFGSFATNGGQCRYNGTIIPASDNYRIGFPGTNGALSMIQPLVDIDNTPRGLIVGGATPVLVADNTFTGDTVLRAGRLFLGRQLALQNSALNVGNGAGDGINGQICFLSSNTSGATQGQLTDQPTLGGLIGARNLASIYNSANQNNTTRLAITAVLGLTLDVDTGKTHTYSGNARLATGMYLTKTGPGTQVLSGANDYTGATSVNQGTLALVSGSHTSDITVASGASLGFTLGSPSTSSKSVTLVSGHTIKITGTVDNSSNYQLMTATLGFTGAPTLDSPIPNYVLQKQNSDTELWLVYTPSGSPYSTWAGAAVFSNDDNGDGVDNGLAWFLGAADPNVSALNKLPTVSTPTGFLQLNFTRANPYSPAKLFVEYGNDLVGWTKLELPASSGIIGGDIDVTVTAGPPDAIQVKIPNSHAAGGKLFGRLSAEENP